MDTWYSMSLGDGIMAAAPTAELEEKFLRSFTASGKPPEMAVFIRPEEWERAKKIFNILAERVEDVTPWLAQQMLSNQRNGVILSYSPAWKMLWKFIRSPFVQRQVFD